MNNCKVELYCVKPKAGKREVLAWISAEARVNREAVVGNIEYLQRVCKNRKRRGYWVIEFRRTHRGLCDADQTEVM